MTEMLHELVIETFHVYAKLFGEVRRAFLGELLQERLQLRVGCLMRNSRPPPYRRIINIVGAARKFQRKVTIGILPGEPRGHYPYDRISLVDQLNLAADHPRVA